MSEGPVEFRVLGPVELVAGDRPAALGPKLRELLSLLLLNPNRVAERDWLIDQLWRGEPPAAAVPTLRSYAYHLRKLLGRPDSGPALRGMSGGYTLVTPLENLDAHRFEAAAAQGERALNQGFAEQAAHTLRAGLSQWRGPAFAGVDLPAVRARARHLEATRLEAAEQCIGAEIDMGTTGSAAAELEALIADHPLRENLWRLLMLSLYRKGRQGEAIDAYRRLRRLLDVELGAAPSAPIEALLRRILEGDPGLLVASAHPKPRAAAVPRQLPAASAHFTGRAAPLAELDGLLAGTASETHDAVAVAVVSGTAGIGKTALVLHWAHRIADRFPDGQLYLDLRGFDPAGRPITAAAGLRTLLESLGTAPGSIPDDSDAQVGLYRSLLAGKRVLVVLDNASEVDQVRPLLPGTTGSLAIVTGRIQLSGLITQGAQPISLMQFGDDDARGFLDRRLGTSRTAVEPEAVQRIIDACAGLPLALAIVAARAAARPDFPLAVLASDLHDASDRLDALADPDPATDLRAVFASSYRALPAGAARLFRLLSLHPGPEFSLALAASIAGAAPKPTQRLLTELARANLLIEQRPGRYAFHDLLRAYAAELAAAEDSRADRHAAIRRLLDSYLQTTFAVSNLIDTARDPIDPVPAAPDVTATRPADREAASAWFATEGTALLAAVELAADSGFDAHCWQLSWTLRDHLDQGNWQVQAAVWQTALEAARRLGDADAQVRVIRLLAEAFSHIGRIEDGRALLDAALALCRDLDDRVGEAHVHFVHARLWMRQGSIHKGIDSNRRAFGLYRATGHPVGQAAALNSLGWYLSIVGDQHRARTYCEHAMALMVETGDRYGQAATADSLGDVHHRLGQYARAVAYYEQALTLYRELGGSLGEAEAARKLGDTRHAAGDLAAARCAWQQAARIYDDLGSADAERIRADIARLPLQPSDEKPPARHGGT